jgi:hypothetical protein
MLFTIVYYIFRHFYMEIADENELKEMVGFIKEIIIYILHTEKGSQVGMKCIWNSSAKV